MKMLCYGNYMKSGINYTKFCATKPLKTSRMMPSRNTSSGRKKWRRWSSRESRMTVTNRSRHLPDEPSHVATTCIRGRSGTWGDATTNRGDQRQKNGVRQRTGVNNAHAPDENPRGVFGIVPAIKVLWCRNVRTSGQGGFSLVMRGVRNNCI